MTVIKTLWYGERRQMTDEIEHSVQTDSHVQTDQRTRTRVQKTDFHRSVTLSHLTFDISHMTFH